MSRVYFHTPDRTVELWGRERAYMGQLAGNIALQVIAPSHEDYEWARSVSTDEADYAFSDPDRWLDGWKTWFRVGWNDGGLLVRGERIGTTDLALNTLIATRSPALTLLAKLHGMCEEHAWIDAGDAEWLADLIDVGRHDNVLRPEMGWEGVADLARGVAGGLPGPIVTSYSVCEWFPNQGIADWVPPLDDGGEPDDDAWYGLSESEQWRLAVKGMQARGHNRQIAPATMDQGFMSGASAFDLCAERDLARLEAEWAEVR